jgi:hypothetical protein
MPLAAREPRIFRALAAVPLVSMLPPAGSRGARAADRASALLRISTRDAPFVVLLRRGFVIVSSDPLREVRMARTLAPFGGARPAAVVLEARVAVAPADSGSDVTASFDFAARGVAARLMAAAAWPVLQRVVTASLDRWLSAVGAEAAR